MPPTSLDFCVSTIPAPNISFIPVLEREGMVPRERALLRRPGREEGDALRSRGLWWWLMSLDRLGGGAGMKDSTKSGGGKRGWPLGGGAVELPARNLQHKSNATGSNMNSWSKQHVHNTSTSARDISCLPVLHITSTVRPRPSLECEMTAVAAQLPDKCHCSCCDNKCGPAGRAHICNAHVYLFRSWRSTHTSRRVWLYLSFIMFRLQQTLSQNAQMGLQNVQLQYPTWMKPLRLQ